MTEAAAKFCRVHHLIITWQQSIVASRLVRCAATLAWCVWGYVPTLCADAGPFAVTAETFFRGGLTRARGCFAVLRPPLAAKAFIDRDPAADHPGTPCAWPDASETPCTRALGASCARVAAVRREVVAMAVRGAADMHGGGHQRRRPNPTARNAARLLPHPLAGSPARRNLR